MPNLNFTNHFNSDHAHDFPSGCRNVCQVSPFCQQSYSGPHSPRRPIIFNLLIETKVRQIGNLAFVFQSTLHTFKKRLLISQGLYTNTGGGTWTVLKLTGTLVHYLHETMTIHC